MTQTIYQRMQRDLRAAMSKRERATVSALRTAMSAIDNAGAVEAKSSGYHVGLSPDVPRRELDEAAVKSVLSAEIAEREQAIEELAGLRQEDHVERRRQEVMLLSAYLEAGAPGH